MSGPRFNPEHQDVVGSWASEALPMSVRRELLERELRKLGFQRVESQRAGGASQPQQQAQSARHPQADGGSHGD